MVLANEISGSSGYDPWIALNLSVYVVIYQSCDLDKRCLDQVQLVIQLLHHGSGRIVERRLLPNKMETLNMSPI
ncbi:hypothetical protein AYI68_g8123 [Smittium mucronatum]|uniref:Uncharacterized protein n=1 Tax=Smittium mucronatum TaxID=133383 RepID=A0A1R0GLT3_9FUNG|nr:hypothetical protein AYI68_g8123 [Smittium mucronatum]